MARIETIEVSIPREVYVEYRDYLIDELSPREYKDRDAGASTFGNNGAVAEALLADCILPHLAEVLYGEGDKSVVPTPEGGLEIEQHRDESGNFQ